jgi:hypothetical protein
MVAAVLSSALETIPRRAGWQILFFVVQFFSLALWSLGAALTARAWTKQNLQQLAIRRQTRERVTLKLQ